jgi:hypothetical protein
MDELSSNNQPPTGGGSHLKGDDGGPVMGLRPT